MTTDALSAVLERLSSLESIRYVSEDWGQLNQYQPPVKFPCVLVDIDSVDYSDQGRNIQSGVAMLLVRIADQRVQNRSTKSPEPDKSLSFLGFTQEIYKALQGLSGATFTPLKRQRTIRIQREDSVREYDMAFTFGFTDSQAEKTTRKVSASPAISVR